MRDAQCPYIALCILLTFRLTPSLCFFSVFWLSEILQGSSIKVLVPNLCRNRLRHGITWIQLSAPIKHEYESLSSAKTTRHQTVQRLLPDCMSHYISIATFPCQKKRVQSRTFTPDPRTFTKMSRVYLQTPLVSWWYRAGAFIISLSDRDFHPVPPCPPGHLPPQTECADVHKYRHLIKVPTYLLSGIFLHWGKTLTGDGWPDYKSYLYCAWLFCE
jgi:hypothetical protein